MGHFHLTRTAATTAVLFTALALAASANAEEPDHVVVGVGAAVAPSIQGSTDYRVLPLPVIDIKQGWVFADLRNGIGAAPIDTDHVTLGVSAVFLQGYRHRDIPNGVRRLSDGVGARAFANLREAGFVATLGVVKGVSGQTRGVIADASVGYPVAVGSRLTLTPTIATTWANAKYNDRYFGIDADEASASRLRRFSAGAGFKDVTEALTTTYRLTDRMSIGATAGVISLVGDVRNSPLVQKKTRPIGGLSISYRL
jgi:outer membrane protein